MDKYEAKEMLPTEISENETFITQCDEANIDIDDFEVDEIAELIRLWKSEFKQIMQKMGGKGRKGRGQSLDMELDPESASVAVAFVLHGVQAYMVEKGWEKIDRAQEMGLNYYAKKDLARMKKEGKSPLHR